MDSMMEKKQSTNALVIDNSSGKYQCNLTERPIESLKEASIIIECKYSSLNYKDALAVTGKGKILKKFPLTPGIDVSGVVIESNSTNFKVDDHVLATGCGLGETQHGGYCQQLTIPEAKVLQIPTKLSLRTAMIYGTAGFTAALAIKRMLQNNQQIDFGPILMSGASGGVGCFSVYLLSTLGFEVWALTSKKENHEFLKKFGAQKCIETQEWLQDSRPLESVAIGGGIDNLGGKVLEKMLASCQLWGNIASIGLAKSPKLDTSVLPFILRGVSLLGASSNNCPLDLRLKTWELINQHHQETTVDAICQNEIKLNEVQKYSEDLIANKLRGRTIVDLSS